MEFKHFCLNLKVLCCFRLFLFVFLGRFQPETHLPLQAVGSGRVSGLQEACRGGPAGGVLPGWRLLRSDPRIAADGAAAEGPVEGEQGGVAAAADVEGHI